MVHPFVQENLWREEDPCFLRVVLYQPEIPQNTGNIARTCAATHTPLHLVGPLGFRLSDRYLKRAGLDYWPHVQLAVHEDIAGLRREVSPGRWVYFSTRGDIGLYDYRFRAGDCLVFGSETRGLPSEMLHDGSGQVVGVPMDLGRVRSLNLATAVGVVLFEALRQLEAYGCYDFRRLTGGPPLTYS